MIKINQNHGMPFIFPIIQKLTLLLKDFIVDDQKSWFCHSVQILTFCSLYVSWLDMSIVPSLSPCLVFPPPALGPHRLFPALLPTALLSDWVLIC